MLKPLLFTYLLLVGPIACKARAPGLKESVLRSQEQSRSQMTSAEIHDLADGVAIMLRESLSENEKFLKASAKVSCAQDPDLAARRAARLLWVGHGGECLKLIETCSNSAQDARFATLEAKCAGLELNYQRTHDAYERALAGVTPGEQATAIALNFANFAMSSQYADEVEGILRRAGFSQVERANWGKTVRYFAASSLEQTSIQEIEEFVTRQIQVATDPDLQCFLVNSWFASLAGPQARYTDALIFFRANLLGRSDNNPENWFPSLYSAMYKQPKDGLALARTVFDAFGPYGSPLSYLPTEENVYTYSELYENACRDSLLSGKQLADYRKAAKDWTSGRSSKEATLEKVKQWLTPGRDKADLLTLYGSLNEAIGNIGEATDAYLRAHKACIYYNRAHWGLVGLRRRARGLAFADASALLSGVDSALSQVSYPVELKAYISNYAGLDAAELKAVKYALRTWARQVKPLAENKKFLYIKRGFEFLSDAPGREAVSNERITYPYDNRLWDDVRGIGGSVVIADLGETSRLPLGDYNLVTHEVAHQVHMGLFGPTQEACLKLLYANAKARNLFAEEYSRTNTTEYFAQGVTYYSIPPDAPVRLGKNRSWLVANDPDLLRFVEDVLAATDIKQVPCRAKPEVVNKPESVSELDQALDHLTKPNDPTLDRSIDDVLEQK